MSQGHVIWCWYNFKHVHRYVIKLFSYICLYIFFPICSFICCNKKSGPGGWGSIHYYLIWWDFKMENRIKGIQMSWNLKLPSVFLPSGIVLETKIWYHIVKVTSTNISAWCRYPQNNMIISTVECTSFFM